MTDTVPPDVVDRMMAEHARYRGLTDEQRLAETVAVLDEQGPPTPDEVMEALVDMAFQHFAHGGAEGREFDTGALSANRDAAAVLQRAGRLEVLGAYGRMWRVRWLDVTP